MIDWLIGILQDLQTKQGLDYWQAFVWLFSIVTTAIVTVWGLTRKWAKGKYERAIDEMKSVETARSTAEQLARDRQKIIDDLKTDLQAERDKSPEAFLKTLATHERDGMWEFEVRDSRAYVERQRTALHRAFGTLAQRHIETAMEDGAAGFENARMYALAAVAVDPEDRLTRMLSEELAQGAAILAANPGAKIRLADDAGREERLSQRDAAGLSFEAVHRACLSARDQGAYALMRELAAHGVRAARRTLGPESDATLTMRAYFSEATRVAGMPVEALALAQNLLPTFEKVNGAEHPNTLSMRFIIAACLKATGHMAEALTAAQDLLPLRKKVSGADHSETLTTRSLIASILKETGRTEEALAEAQDLLPLRKKVIGAKHLHTLSTRYLIASCLRDAGRMADALTAAQDLLPMQEKFAGEEHPETLTTRQLIATCLQESKHIDEALTAAQDLLPLQEKISGAEHPETLVTRHLIAVCLHQAGRTNEALEAAQYLLPLREKIIGAEHPQTLTTRTVVARCLIDLGQLGEARNTHAGVVEMLRSKGLGDTNVYLKQSLQLEALLANAD